MTGEGANHGNQVPEVLVVLDVPSVSDVPSVVRKRRDK